MLTRERGHGWTRVTTNPLIGNNSEAAAWAGLGQSVGDGCRYEAAGDQDQGKPLGAGRGGGATLAVSPEGASFSLQLSTGYPSPTPTGSSQHQLQRARSDLMA